MKAGYNADATDRHERYFELRDEGAEPGVAFAEACPGGSEASRFRYERWYRVRQSLPARQPGWQVTASLADDARLRAQADRLGLGRLHGT